MTAIDQVLFSGDSNATVNHDPDVQRGEFGAYDLKLTAPHLAHQICPYSKSVRGNIEISTNIVTQ